MDLRLIIKNHLKSVDLEKFKGNSKGSQFILIFIVWTLGSSNAAIE